MLIPLSTIIYSYFLRKIYSLLRSNHFTTTDPLIINTNETKLCLQPTPVLSSRSAAITERSVPLIVLLLIRDRFHANASLELALEPRIDASSSRVHHAAVKEGGMEKTDGRPVFNRCAQLHRLRPRVSQLISRYRATDKSRTEPARLTAPELHGSGHQPVQLYKLRFTPPV